jgi:aryl-alcohol dehydrogenase-like predicted oxidoreductase
MCLLLFALCFFLSSCAQVLHGVATKHGCTISNVAARWVLDQPGVSGIIIGARNSSHVAETQATFSLVMDEEDRGRIQEVLKKGKPPNGDCYTWERGGQW